jgi:hypothetical protein
MKFSPATPARQRLWIGIVSLVGGEWHGLDSRVTS